MYYYLNLNLDIPKLTTKIENVSINEGQDAIFTCKFVSFPVENKICWLKNDTNEIINNDENQISKENDTIFLKLINPKYNENGSTYLVKISNELGEISSNKAVLNINSGPVFITDPLDQNVLKDKEARFECIVKSNPKPNVIWILNDKELTAKDGVKIEKDIAKDKYTLIIPKVLATHIGKYTVKALNEFGSAEKLCNLFVSEIPKIINKLENLSVNENEQAKFIIKITGKPKPTSKWYKDDTEIIIDESNEIIENDDEIIFVIKNCNNQLNSGVYSVKVSNEFGEALSNKATLTINS